MANETHTITLTARDGVSQAFQKVAREAKAAGTAGDDAGKRGSRGMADWSSAASKTGLALGALTALAVRAAGESEAIQQRLQQSVENTGTAYDDLEGRIDAMNKTALDFAFDDEAASAALQSLVDATGDADLALTDMNLVMDVARGRNIDLAAAAKIVAAAEQGRYGSLARLGIQIDDNATREEALGALQAKYAGQAEAYAETNAASWDRMGNAAGNALEKVGGAVDDVALPLMALGALATPISALGGAIGGSAGLAAGITGLATAAAPLVVTMAALAAPIGIATYLITDQDNVMRRAAEATAANNTQLQAYLEWLGQVAGTITPVTAAIEAQGGAADKMLDFFRDTNTEALVSMDGISGFTVNMSDLRGELNNLSPENFQTVLDVARNWGIVWNDPNTWSTEGINEVAYAIVSLNNEQNTAAAVSVDMARGMAVAAYGADDFARKTDTAAAASAANATAMGFEIDALDELIKQREAANATALTKQETRGNEQDAYLAAERAAAERAITESIENQALGLNVQTTDMAELKAMAVERAAAELTAAQNVLTATQSYAGMIGTTNALDAGISVVLGGMDNLGGGVERVSTALGELTTAGDDGGLSQLKQLAEDGRISWMEYESAVAAANDATAANTSTQASLGVILANQAPLLADLAEGQASYVAGLADLSAEEQLLALAYMDSAAAGKVLELQTLAISAANGELGAGGGEFAASIIEGAAQADPILKAMLVDMDLISVDREGNISVNMAGDAVTEVEALTTTLQQLQGAIEVIVNIDLNDDSVVGWVPPELPAATADLNANTVPGDEAVSGALTTWASMAATPTIYANTAPADGSVATSVANADAQSATIDINAYTGPYYANLPATGQVLGTNYIYVETVSLARGIGPHLHGGMVEPAAHGRMPGSAMTLVGETGPELVSLPYGSSVTPASATKARLGNRGGGGGDVYIETLVVQSNDARQLVDTMRGYAIMGARP